MKPLGIELHAGQGRPGPRHRPVRRNGRGLGAGWRRTARDYFDLHHTPDDTLDKIDPQALAQNVAAYAVFAYLAAEAEGDFGSAPKPAAPEAP